MLFLKLYYLRLLICYRAARERSFGIWFISIAICFGCFLISHRLKGLMEDMIRREIIFLGHVIRKDELEKVVLTEYVEGTRDRGKQTETFLTYLSKHKGIYPWPSRYMAVYVYNKPINHGQHVGRSIDTIKILSQRL